VIDDVWYSKHVSFYGTQTTTWAQHTLIIIHKMKLDKPNNIRTSFHTSTPTLRMKYTNTTSPAHEHTIFIQTFNYSRWSSYLLQPIPILLVASPLHSVLFSFFYRWPPFPLLLWLPPAIEFSNLPQDLLISRIFN